MANESGTVLVIGGGGKVGRRVVARLREQGVEARAASRSGEVRFDWNDPGTWKPALEGVDRVFITPLDVVPSPTPAFTAEAVAAGVERLVLLSARGTGVPGYFGDGPSGEVHLAGEEAVRASGVQWTVLRPGWFMQNFSEGEFLAGVRAGELALPAGEDGASAFVDAEDIAAVAAAALTGEGHAGQEYELTGPRPLGIAEALEEIAAASGRAARYLPIGVEEFAGGLVAQGVSREEAELWAAALTPIRTRAEAPVADGVRRALGREPRDFAEFARDGAAAWRS
ncbi:NAD(P)H-binding protein [Nocardiopsis potens]|uniref:NAD(P)H-binding protein n=1 Tax=Nocardiopsis potens TaxID=1246458 RepID=UPI00034D5A83|nr:NAD(P)H-binding protein [Nocardiopsis potens]